MRTLSFAIVVLFTLATISGRSANAASVPPADAKLDLYLLAGQSNMAGRGKVEAQDKIADPRVWVLNAQDEWAPAIDPLHFDKGKVNGVGPGRAFAITVANARPANQIGLIPCAVGGVSIGQWKPGGALYTNAIRRAKVAMEHGTIRGILWHQGESDTKPDKIAAYPGKLDQLMASFRKDLDAPDVPLIVGQLGTFESPKLSARAAFNEMILKYANDTPNTACALSDGLKSIGDDTHFNAASQRELGRRYAVAFLKLVKTQSSQEQK